MAPTRNHSTARDEATRAVDVVAEVRRKETLLKTGALQHAIFNSANFSSIATDEKGVIQIVRIPLVVHLPRALQGQTTCETDAVASLVDITPTLYYLLGHRPW